MLLTASQQSLSPETFGDDMKMFAKTGSTTSSGYCSSPQASDESFDGDKMEYFGSGYKIWGENNSNSEHIAHNILSQLFEEDRTKSPLQNTMSADSGIVWSNDYQNPFPETLSSPLSAFSDETSDSASYMWGGKQLAPGSHLPPNNGGWPASLHSATPATPLPIQPNYPFGGSPHHHQQQQQQQHHQQQPQFTPFNQQFNLNGGGGGGGNGTFPAFGGMSGGMSGGMGGGMPAPHPGFTGGFTGGYHGAGRIMNQNRAVPADVLQQSILRRKLAEQNFMGDSRCFPSSPNKLYPTAPNVISLSHHKKLPLSFNQLDVQLTTQQPQISPDSKVLLTTIESCWSQLLQLNREQKKYEYEVSTYFSDFVKPIPMQPKHKSPFKLDLLIQNTESTHAMILAFVDNVEKVAKAGSQMKGVIVKYVSMLDDICREMLDLRRQIHPVHGLFNDETIRKLINTLEIYSKHTKIVRSNLYMMVTMLRQTKKN